MSFYKPKIFKHYHVSFLKLGCPNFLNPPSPLVLKRPNFMNPSPLQNLDIINGWPLIALIVEFANAIFQAIYIS